MFCFVWYPFWMSFHAFIFILNTISNYTPWNKTLLVASYICKKYTKDNMVCYLSCWKFIAVQHFEFIKKILYRWVEYLLPHNSIIFKVHSFIDWALKILYSNISRSLFYEFMWDKICNQYFNITKFN